MRCRDLTPYPHLSFLLGHAAILTTMHIGIAFHNLHLVWYNSGVKIIILEIYTVL
jgi:hypothetical protein